MFKLKKITSHQTDWRDASRYTTCWWVASLVSRSTTCCLPIRGSTSFSVSSSISLLLPLALLLSFQAIHSIIPLPAIIPTVTTPLVPPACAISSDFAFPLYAVRGHSEDYGYPPSLVCLVLQSASHIGWRYISPKSIFSTSSVNCRSANSIEESLTFFVEKEQPYLFWTRPQSFESRRSSSLCSLLLLVSLFPQR